MTQPKYAVFRLGSDYITRYQAAHELDVESGAAWSRLQKACEDLGIKSFAMLLNTPPEHFAVLENVAEKTIYTFLQFRHWKNVGTGYHATVTVASLKRRERAAHKHSRTVERKAKAAHAKTLRRKRLEQTGTDLLSQ